MSSVVLCVLVSNRQRQLGESVTRFFSRARLWSSLNELEGTTVEERIIELETRIAFQDDTIAQLNEVIIELRGELGLLEKRIKRAESKLRVLTPDLVRPQEDEDPPPHY